jgi:PsbP
VFCSPYRSGFTDGVAACPQESTLSVELLSSSSRRGERSGVTIYDYEYELNSTRGRKLILSSVSVSNGKLYIVNGTAKCGADGCGSVEAAAGTMRAMARSFDVVT